MTRRIAPTWPFAVLALLLCGDLAFIAAHCMHVSHFHFSSFNWKLDRDRGYGEFYQYTKFVLAIVSLLMLYARRRMSVLLGWTVILVYMLLDDSTRVHEHFGEAFEVWFPSVQWGAMRSRDFGEIVLAAIVLSAVGPLLWMGWRGKDPGARAFSIDFAMLLVAFGICGVGVDVLHRFAPPASAFELPLTIAEDGGELIVISALCFYVLQWLAHPQDVRFRPGAPVSAFLVRT